MVELDPGGGGTQHEMLFIRDVIYKGGGGVAFVPLLSVTEVFDPNKSPLFPGLLALQPFFLELKMFHVSLIFLLLSGRCFM